MQTVETTYKPITFFIGIFGSVPGTFLVELLDLTTKHFPGAVLWDTQAAKSRYVGANMVIEPGQTEAL